MLRTVIVVGLSALFIGLTLPNMWLPVGGLVGAAVDSHFVVRSVTKGSIADVAGLRAGDRVDLASTTAVVRAALEATYDPKAGETLPFSVFRDGHRHDIAIYQGPVVTGEYVLGIVKRSSASIFIVVAAMLLILRPSPMLWGFFLFALGSTHGSPLILEFVNPTIAALAAVAFACAYDILGSLGLLVFATRFPSRSSGGVRGLIDRAIPYVVAAVAVGRLPALLFLAAVPLPPALSIGGDFITAGAFALGIIALLAGFLEVDASERQRLRWVVVGFAVFGAALLYQKIAPLFPGVAWPDAWTNAGIEYSMLNGLVIVIPLTVAYAVLKHRVLDLNFVIGRGLVYAILTSMAVAVFAIIEWFVGDVLAQTKLATAGEVVAAIAIGFWLNGLHARVDRFVDAVIFRRRHRAEKRLARVAAGLAHSESYSTIAQIMVKEPADALGFRSAAFYRKTDAGDFVCDAAAGIERPLAALPAHDPLLVHLNGARDPVMLDEIGWQLPGTNLGLSSPIMAIPIFIRHELRAIAFYGVHATGEAIDPDEMRVLSSLCSGAATALDHTAAAELSNRLEEYRQTVEALRTEVQALRGTVALPTP